MTEDGHPSGCEVGSHCSFDLRFPDWWHWASFCIFVGPRWVFERAVVMWKIAIFFFGKAVLKYERIQWQQIWASKYNSKAKQNKTKKPSWKKREKDARRARGKNLLLHLSDGCTGTIAVSVSQRFLCMSEICPNKTRHSALWNKVVKTQGHSFLLCGLCSFKTQASPPSPTSQGVFWGLPGNLRHPVTSGIRRCRGHWWEEVQDLCDSGPSFPTRHERPVLQAGTHVGNSGPPIRERHSDAGAEPSRRCRCCAQCHVHNRHTPAADTRPLSFQQCSRKTTCSWGPAPHYLGSRGTEGIKVIQKNHAFFLLKMHVWKATCLKNSHNVKVARCTVYFLLF